MAFTKEYRDKLTQLSNDKAVLIVNGINSCGKPFETRGFLNIGKRENGEVYGIGDKGFLLYTGQYIPRYQFESDLPLLCDYKDIALGKEYSPEMIVGSVKVEGTDEIVFENPEILEVLKDAPEDYKQNPEGFYYASSVEDACKYLISLLGKPIVFGEDGEKGYLKHFRVISDTYISMDVTNGQIQSMHGMFKYGDSPFFSYGVPELDEDAVEAVNNYGSQANQNSQGQPSQPE